MEAEDGITPTHAADEHVVDAHEPQAVLPLSPSPDDSGSAREDPSPSTTPAADVQPQKSDQSLLVHATPSEAEMSAESEQSIQADVSEILVPSSTMALLHSRRPRSGTDAPMTDVQPGQSASPTMQIEEQPAEGGADEIAQISSTEAPATTSGDITVAEQLVPDKDVPAASGQQEGDAAPFAHATFVVPTENWKHLQMVPLATTAAEIKHSLCSNWNIAESALSVKYNRQELQDAQSLASCGIQANPCLFVLTMVTGRS